MVRFTPKTKEEMCMLETVHRNVQRLICLMAHDNMGITPTELKGIFKYEGGVTVNGKEIAIYEDHVRDDFSYDPKEKPEERAVADSIIKLLETVDFTDQQTATTSISKIYDEYPLSKLTLLIAENGGLFGDPLRNFFQI